MATKATLTLTNQDGETKAVQGYKLNDDLGLYQNPETKSWYGVHIRTGNHLTGKNGIWKQKRQCLAYLQHFVDANFDFAVDNVAEMMDKNPEAERIYREAVEKGNLA